MQQDVTFALCLASTRILFKRLDLQIAFSRAVFHPRPPEKLTYGGDHEPNRNPNRRGYG